MPDEPLPTRQTTPTVVATPAGGQARSGASEALSRKSSRAVPHVVRRLRLPVPRVAERRGLRTRRDLVSIRRRHRRPPATADARSARASGRAESRRQTAARRNCGAKRQAVGASSRTISRPMSRSISRSVIARTIRLATVAISDRIHPVFGNANQVRFRPFATGTAVADDDLWRTGCRLA